MKTIMIGAAGTNVPREFPMKKDVPSEAMFLDHPHHRSFWFGHSRINEINFWEWQGTKTEPDYWPRLVVREGDWKLAMADEGKRVELHRLTDDRAEASDVAQNHPDIVARLTKLALDWKATLPTTPNPECLTNVPDPGKDSPPKTGATGSGLTPEDRVITFDRWDTNRDGVVTLAEYLAGQKPNDLLEARFKRLNKSGDGKLTREEFAGQGAR